MTAKEYNIKVGGKYSHQSLSFHSIAVKKVLGISNKTKYFDYKSGCVMAYSKPFHKRLNSKYT